MKVVQTGTWSADLDLKPFEPYWDELPVYQNVILRGNRIVVPASLKKRVLKLAHEVHVGIVRTKQLLRAKYFWIGMNRDIEVMIKNCPECVASRPLNVNTPLQPTQLPKGPWVKGAVDIVGPIESKYLVTYIDYYSSYPEVAITRDITSKNIICILMNIFSRHGFPEEIVSDNGRQFVSQEFEQFLRSKNIKHVRSSPYYPRSNGKIERFHRYLKKNFQTVTLQGRSWEVELPQILMLYRSIPHPTTKKTPASMLFNGEIRTKLPEVDLQTEAASGEVEGRNELYQRQMKRYHDKKYRVKSHYFAVGDVVYVARKNVDAKLVSKFDLTRYVIIDFLGRDTCKVVNTVNGGTYIRNIKFLKLAPIDEGDLLLFDDKIAGKEVDKKVDGEKKLG